MVAQQGQADTAPSGQGAHDFETRMVRLEEEVELLKISIKRLLIDLRERMNDMQNPFLPAGAGDGNASRRTAGNGQQRGGVRSENGNPEPGAGPDTTPVPSAEPRQVRNDLKPVPAPADFVQAIKHQLSGTGGAVIDAESVEGKVRLQMVFRLFAWTTKNVRLFGHDRVDLMLESYRAMGYISPESCSLVKDIARLMPSTLGEQHDINAEEYVTELYELNHILNPGDMSLDRDMIEVLIKKRIASGADMMAPHPERPGSEVDARDAARKKDRI